MKGKQAEHKACAYLIANGYKIIARNIHIGKIEIDILCEKNDQNILVEVKYRSNLDFLTISKTQQRNLDIALSHYIHARFDIIVYNKNWEIFHYKNAYISI